MPGDPAGGVPLLSELLGKQSIDIPAGSMKPRATSGAGEATYDSGANDITIDVIDFDTATQEYAHFTTLMPKGWNEGTVTFTPYSFNPSGAAAQTVRYTLAGRAISHDDAVDGAFGAAQSSDATFTAAGDLHVGAESAAITIGGAPAQGDMVVWQLSRDVTNDNMGGDSRLAGILLHLTFDAVTDA